MTKISPNLRQSVILYLLFTTTAFTISYTFIHLTHQEDKLCRLWSNLYNPLWLVVPISVGQELIFRGWLMPTLKKRIHNLVRVILINAALFSLAHFVLPFPEIVVPGAFAIGLGFAAIYYFYPNLVLISLSHTLLNLLSVPFCQNRF